MTSSAVTSTLGAGIDNLWSRALTRARRPDVTIPHLECGIEFKRSTAPGMISGIAAAIKLSQSSIRVIGVEPELASDASASFHQGHLVSFGADQVTQTIADGLRTQSVGPINFEHIRAYVDEIVTVSEEEIFEAMRRLAATPRTVAEPSGAVAVAGFLFRGGELPPSRVNVAIISGGNIEPHMLERLRAGAGVAELRGA